MKKALIPLILVLTFSAVNGLMAPEEIISGVEPSFDPAGNQIVFSSLEGLTRDIHLIDEKGATMSLTEDIYWDGHPSFYPSGDRIVFVSDRSGSRELWSIDTKSRDLFRLTESPSWKADPKVSPSGKVIYTAGRHPNLDIYVLEGGIERRLTYLEGEIYSPVFSPNEEKIAFVNGEDLMIMNADGTYPRVAVSGVYHRGLSWNGPDELIYLVRGRGIDLMRYDLNTGRSEMIYEGITDSWEVNPAVTSTGDIAFSTDKDGNYRIQRMKVELEPVLPSEIVPLPESIVEPDPAPIHAAAPSEVSTPETDVIERPVGDPHTEKEFERTPMEEPQEEIIPDPDHALDDIEIDHNIPSSHDELPLPEPHSNPSEKEVWTGELLFFLTALGGLLVVLLDGKLRRLYKHDLLAR